MNFQELNLCTYISLELASEFLYALCELLEEQTVLCGNNKQSSGDVLRKLAKFTCTRDSFLVKLQAGSETLLKTNLDKGVFL